MSTALTLGAALAARADADPDGLAVVVPPARLTYAELHRRAAGAASVFVSHGVRPGDHVALLMPNTIELVLSVFGLAFAGAVAVPLNTRSEVPELERSLEHSEARLVVTVPPVTPERDLVACARTAAAAAALHSSVLVIGPDEFAPSETTDGLPVVSANNVAVLLYTSGTTSAPKGCLISHEAIVRTGTARIVERRHGTENAIWTPCPLFHVGALVPLIGCVATGTPYITTRRFEPGDALRLLAEHRVTIALPLFPAFTDAMIDHDDFATTDLSALSQVFTSGPDRNVRRARAAFAPARLVSGYGMTEVCGVAASSRLDDSDEERLAWDGSPFDGIEIGIAEPVTGALLPPGETGEIVVRGYCCFDGYYRDRDATHTAFDAEGWFHTGDVGIHDGCGHVAFRGRYKDMLKVGGENVSALEVETFLGALPGVRHVEVVGAPDERLEEVVAAFVELEPGAAVTAEDVVAHCAGRLSRFKVPRHVVFVGAGEWPMSSTKVDKGELRHRVRAGVGAA